MVSDWSDLARSPEYEAGVSPRHVRQLTVTSPEIVQGGAQRRASDLSNPTPEAGHFQHSPEFRSGWSQPHVLSSNHGSFEPNGAGDYPRADRSPSGAYEQTKHRSNSALASSMMRTVVASGNDALNILFEAATAQEDSHVDTSSESISGPPSTGPSQERTPGNSDAAFESVTRTIHPAQLSNVSHETLNIWEACRFVKMGWFTAREAVTFVDLSVSIIPCCSRKKTDWELDSTKTCLVYRQYSQTFTPNIAITTG
jgi:hypothetical protein